MEKNFYENDREITLQVHQQLSRQESRLSLGRILAFLLLILCTAAAYDGYSYLYYASLCLLAAFLLLIHAHNKVLWHLRLAESRLAVLKDCLDRFTSSWRDFPQDGAPYLRQQRPQDTDLNLFGPSSLYQYLCRARTRAGRDCLAAALSPRPAKASFIRRRQKAIEELLSHPRLCVELEALSRLLPDGHDTSELVQGLEQEHLLKTPFLLRTAWLLPAITLIACGLALAGMSDWTTVLMFMLLQLALTILLVGRNSRILAPLNHIQRELHLYGNLFVRLEETSFSSPHLRELQALLTTRPAASQTLKRLAYLADAVNMRRNPAFYVLANTLLLWDCHCAALFLHWQDLAAQNLARWLSVWTEMEALLSLATIGETRKTYAFPEILETPAPRIEGRALTSPLLPEERAVPNDADLLPETYMITGSNMSGKTTWLRTIATNAILAYAGAPVCGESLRLSLFSIFTSIRVHDDLGEGLSTFYAELLRIKEMIESSRQETPMLICIDEIFKGTNSADRIIGAREAIRRLTTPWSIVLVTTHDFELCDLETGQGKPVNNWHFEESYENDKIHFDFKARPGRCRTTNAQYLLRMAGIIETPKIFSEKIAQNQDK